MDLLVIHTIFGLSWDELASIVGIMAAFFGALGWIIHTTGRRAGHFINENVHRPVNQVYRSVQGLSDNVDKLRVELHQHATTSSETLIKMQDKDNDFESRISYLESVVNKFIKEKL